MACIATAGQLNAQSISVTATGGTAGPTSYATLSSAFTAINAGTHQGSISISVVGNTTEPAATVALVASGGTASYTAISIKPVGGNWTINSASTPSSNRGLVELNGADNVTIDGDDPATAGTRNLSFVMSTSSGNSTAVIRISSNTTSGTDGANNVTIKNCTLTGSRSSATNTTDNFGINFSNYSTSSLTSGGYSNNALIENNLITRCYYGVYANGASATNTNTGLIIRNNVMGSATSGDNIGARGILVVNTSATAGSSSAQIVGNDIRVGTYGASGFSLTIAGIEIGAVNAGCIINRNNLHDISQPSSSGYGAHGIYVTSGTSNAGLVITNNFIRDCKMALYQTDPTSQYIPCGVYFYSSPTGVIFNHNTVVMNDQLVSSSSYTSVAVNAQSGTTFSQFLNNILVNNHASSGAFAFYTGATATISAATVNNNNYYVNAAARVGYYSGANRISLADWQTATGKDALSINENPPFVSATDLHLGNAAITQIESGGAATSTTGVTTDFDNGPRPGANSNGYGTAPDIGADEFDGIKAYTCPTPAPGATIASNTTVCSGATVNFSLANATTGTGVSYMWQTSPDNVTYTDVAGATLSTYTASPTASLYYRCRVTCGNGPVSTNSTPVLVAFPSQVTGTTPAARCGTGTVNLAATGTAGATMRWYAASTGGTALGSGNSFTTPSISANTDYFVSAEGTSNSAESTVGTATTTTSATGYPTAFMNRHSQYWMQMVFTAAELNAAGLMAGNITALKFRITNLGDAANVTNFTVMLGTTSAGTLSAFTTTGLTPVYGPSTYTSAVGVNTITFSTPYNWDGVSNLIVDIRQNGIDNINNATTYYTATTGNTVVHAATSSTSATWLSSGPTPTTSTSRLNTTFVGVGACPSPRTAVTATVTTAPAFTISAAQTICNNGIGTLAVTSPTGNYTSYTWSPATGLYTDPGATVAYVAGNSAATVYVKSATAGAATYTASALHSTSLCANVATSIVTVLPASATVTGPPSAICASGTGTFNLAPATGYGAGTTTWQSSANNTSFTDIAAATGTSYTTPVITSTTYYRVTVKNSAGAVCFNTVSDTAVVSNPLISSTTPGSRCGPGTVSLAAVASEGTVSWYANSSGGSAIGTGSSFTTPSISANTTYYAAANVGASSGNATIGAGALTTVTGSPDYTGVSPYAYHWGNYKHQILILASELNAAGVSAGNITSLAFDVVTAGSPAAAFNNFSIKLIPTTQTALTATFVSGGTSVYSSTSVTPTTGLNTYNFSTAFVWDGVSNVVVQTCFNNNNTGAVSSSAEVKYDNTSFVSQTIFRADNTQNNVCSETAGNANNDGPIVSKRPKMVLGYSGGCASPRVAVLATVNPKPTVNVTPSGTVQICAGSTTTLTATGGGNYQWRNAAGEISGQTANTLVTGTTGVYKVVVTTPATGCADSSAAITVNVNPLPVVNLGNDTTFCAGNLLVLNAPTGNTYLWNMGATAQSIDVIATGQYSVRVTDANSCVGRDTINVTVNPVPVLNLGNDVTICSSTAGYPLQAPAGFTYLWSTGATTQNVTVNTTGQYWVKATNATTGCFAYDTIQVTFSPSPVVHLGNDTSICAGNFVTLNAPVGTGYNYQWSNGLTGQFVYASTSGQYWVKVTNPAGCSTYDTINVTVNPLPVTNLGPDIQSCVGNTVSLSVPLGNTYLWNTGATSNGIIASTTGNYSVRVTSPQGCIKRDTILVTFNVVPTVNLGPDATFCSNIPYQLTAPSGNGYTYLWNMGATAQSIDATATGQYSVKVTNQFNCFKSDTINLTRLQAPIVELGNDTSVCIATPLPLNAGAGTGYTYQWSTGATTPMISISTPGTYWVHVLAPNGCSEADTITLQNDLLPVIASMSAQQMNDSLFRFFSNGVVYADNIQWFFGDGETSTVYNPSHTYHASGNYTIKAVVYNHCGTDTVTQVINVHIKALGVEEVNLAKQIRVYPNPASDRLTIDNPQGTAIQKVTITNVLGATVMEIHPENSKNFTIEITNLLQGTYSIILHSDKGNMVKKVQISR
jgi:hypothetical protein